MAKKARVSAKAKGQSDEADPARPDAAEDVVDRICTTLATAISGGALKPGSKILDDVIAEHFGVSRTVVRGALDVLQRDHLLERKRNRGAFVAEPSVAEARQLFAARRALEHVIIELAVQNASEDGLGRLEALNEEEAHLPDNTGDRAGLAPAPQFHVELARLGQNEVLTEILVKVLARVSLVNAVYDVSPRDNCGDHRNIIAAIRQRDLKTARRLMQEHLAELEGRVRLTANDGDPNSFVNVLRTFSAR